MFALYLTLPALFALFVPVLSAPVRTPSLQVWKRAPAGVTPLVQDNLLRMLDGGRGTFSELSEDLKLEFPHYTPASEIRVPGNPLREPAVNVQDQAAVPKEAASVAPVSPPSAKAPPAKFSGGGKYWTDVAGMRASAPPKRLADKYTPKLIKKPIGGGNPDVPAQRGGPKRKLGDDATVGKDKARKTQQQQ